MIHENGNLRIKRCRHGDMVYFVNDVFIGHSLDAYGEFSHGETELFSKLIKRGMTVVDVGANIGAHTVFMSKAVGPEGLVLAWEPQSTIHQVLCANLALNFCANAYAYHAGLSDHEGQMNVPAYDYSAGGNFGGANLGAADGLPVRVRTLDSYGLKACDFIKIDVEGMEADVLAGAAETIARHQPILYVENDREEKSADLIRRVLDLGYLAFWHLPPLFNPRNFAGTPVDIFPKLISINMVCAPLRTNLLPLDLKRITSPNDTWRSLV